MKLRSLIPSILLAALSTVHPSLLAQTPEEPPVRLRVSILCWDDVLEITYPGYQGKEPLEVPMQVRSLPYEYEGPPNVVLYDYAPVLPEKITSLKPLAALDLPRDTDRALVILIPNTQSTSDFPYRSIVVDDSFEVFPRQSLRILNFTKYSLAGKLGESVFEVSPLGQSVSLPDSTRGPKHLVPFRMVRYMEDQDVWRPLRSTIFQMYPDSRILALILDDPTQPSLRFVLLKDRTPPEPPSTPIAPVD
ncbi:MAG: hypothetical protein ACQKBT_12755 [Puniceicoccales bacterium]